MVLRLFKLVKNKLIGNKKEVKEEKQEENKEQNWQKRKAELMEKARKNTSVGNPRSNDKNKNEPRKTNQRKKSSGANKTTKTNQPNQTKQKHEAVDGPKKEFTPRPERPKNQGQRNRPPKTAGPRNNDSHEVKKMQPHDWDIKLFNVPQIEGKTRFHDLNLQLEIMHSIYDLGFQYCTPIQEAILKPALEGKDATGRAQTGTGKTAAFLITTINNFLINPPKGVRRPGAPRALVIAPTRELVMQIAADAKNLTKYTNVSVVEIYGGMDYNKQQKRLRSSPVDILVATPGRLLDFQSKRDIFLGSVETLVIDEADRMLDMGFIPDVRKIINSTPPKSKRQTLFFSATLSGEVVRLAQLWTKEPVNVEIEPEKVAGTSVNQIVYIVTNNEKFILLYNIIQKEKLERVIVFANRKDEAHPLQEHLQKYGISCEILSGDVDQKKRIKTLNNFKEGKIRVLVATDVASRGIHVDDVTHVFNYTLPQDPEDYVHRIGRTGRAGALGTSISFASEDDSFHIPAIEQFLGNKLNCIYPNDSLLAKPNFEKAAAKARDIEADKKQNNKEPGANDGNS